MNAGLLCHLAQLVDDVGDPLDPPTWACGVQNEQAAAGQVTLIGRFHPGIDTHTRVHLRGRVFHVTAIVNRAERDVELLLSCTEVFDAA